MPTDGRRWFRFGLKSLLAILTLFGLWCGYYASQALHRRQALTHIAKLGGATWKEGQITTWQTTNDASLWSKLAQRYEDLVCLAFGDELRRNVVAVDLAAVSITEDDLAMLRPLREIEWLSITGQEIDDDAAKQLRAFRQLRWLDIGHSQISLDGVKQLEHLGSLEWLNVAGTRISQSELAKVQTMFPETDTGSTSNPAAVSSPAVQSALDGASSISGQLWTAFVVAPYSEDALKGYLAGIEHASAVDFPQWYISGVFQARREGQRPLLVVEIYNGTTGSFNLGCLLVFDPDGKLLREIAEERVHWSLRGPTKQFNWMDDQSARIEAEHLTFSQGKVVDLIDLTGDGFDEIPTQRWSHTINEVDVGGESTSIYTTKSSKIPCLFCIATPYRSHKEMLIDLGGIAPSVTYRDLKSRTLFLETPCYATTPTGTSLLQELPRRTLATFRWSEAEGTFVGPAQGPDGTWTIVERE
jgi:hypothetical protein